MAEPVSGSWLTWPSRIAKAAVLVGFIALMARTTQRTALEYMALLLLPMLGGAEWAHAHAGATGGRRAALGILGALTCACMFVFAGCELVLAFLGK